MMVDDDEKKDVSRLSGLGGRWAVIEACLRCLKMYKRKRKRKERGSVYSPSIDRHCFFVRVL